MWRATSAEPALWEWEAAPVVACARADGVLGTTGPGGATADGVLETSPRGRLNGILCLSHFGPCVPFPFEHVWQQNSLLHVQTNPH